MRHEVAVALLFAAFAWTALGETSTLDGVLSDSEPLSDRERERLTLLDRYRVADAYPQLEGNGISYLFGHGEPSLVCSPLNVCMLRLDRGERLVRNGILIGDSTRWQVVQSFVASKDVTYLGFKPVDAGLETSLTVMTDGRVYHIRLMSHDRDYMPLVSFRYPDDTSADEEFWDEYERSIGKDASVPSAKRLENAPPIMATEWIADLNWDYDVSGCDCPWRPERVYDDGIRTVIDLPDEARTGDLPVLLITGTRKKGQISNHRVVDNRFIVDQLFEEARLVLDVGRSREEVVIRRKQE